MWLEVLLVTAFCKIGLATEYQSEIVGMNSFSYWSNSTVGSPGENEYHSIYISYCIIMKKF